MAVKRLAVDCSTVCKWELTGEDYAAQARELLQDWQAGVLEVCAPNLLQSEIMSAFLYAARIADLVGLGRERLAEAEAVEEVAVRLE